MNHEALDRWLRTLGYGSASPALHRPGQTHRVAHPYWPEIDDLLRADGEIRARAVFDVDGVPTVCFLDNSDNLLASEERLKAVRQRIWNQNLISIVLVVDGDRLQPLPVVSTASPGPALALATSSTISAFSAEDIQSGAVRDRHAAWFEPGDRVDRRLLANLRQLVDKLTTVLSSGVSDDGRSRAQLFAGQILFVSYLEHRNIVSDTYRQAHGVGSLLSLIRQRDAKGVDALLSQLKHDFNGDFLEPQEGQALSWAELDERAFDHVEGFLSRTDLEGGQRDMWPYNFRFIPVELISGIYESFLGPDQKALGAYYTPRHLANLVVDVALQGSKDILAETYFDGACGSGILLTTAFRRLLGEAERRRGEELPILERIALLRAHIFGSDVSWSACRVTAFSLYLSLLERLRPADIAALQNDQAVKLPPLRGTNILSGDVEGDAFSVENTHAESGRFTIVLSNPPWREPDSGETNSAMDWAEVRDIHLARKQIAGAFAFRLLDSVAPDGKLCLILPMSLLLAPTSARLVNAWLRRVRIERMINFGDLKELMFDTARYACVVVLARPRETGARGIPAHETFEYLVPKADVSLAFGRLAVHSADRHIVQTQAIAADNNELVTRMWGDDYDIALWARLRVFGTFGQLFDTERWSSRKGMHFTDKHAKSVDASMFAAKPFVAADALYPAPVIHPNAFTTFPAVDTVPRYDERVLEVFKGRPRILFPDGPSADLEIRAVFTDRPVMFKHTVGVITSNRQADADLLRFAAVYLRSDLMRYFVVTHVYQVLADRDRVSLRDLKAMPFMLPDTHPFPQTARAHVAEVAALLNELESAPQLEQGSRYQMMKPALERHVHAYFGLTDEESAMVLETTSDILPRIRPYGFASAMEVAQHRATASMLEHYANQLHRSLDTWRDLRRGRGTFHVETFTTSLGRYGAFGVVRVRLDSQAAQPSSSTSHYDADTMIRDVLGALRRDDLLPSTLDENVYLYPDTIIQAGCEVFLVKPLTQRLWLRRRAMLDAERIVDTVTRRPDEPQQTSAREVA